MTEVEDAYADVKAKIASLRADEATAAGWVKTHWVWVIGLTCLIVGGVAGHFIR